MESSNSQTTIYLMCICNFVLNIKENLGNRLKQRFIHLLLSLFCLRENRYEMVGSEEGEGLIGGHGGERSMKEWSRKFELSLEEWTKLNK